MNGSETLRLFVSAALTFGILLQGRLAMSPYTVWGLSLPIFVWCAAPFHWGLWRSFKTQRANTDMLISLSVGVAFLYSTAAVFVPFALLSISSGHLFPIMCALVVSANFGRWLEVRLTERSGEALGKLTRRIPHTANLLDENGTQTRVASSEVRPGAKVCVRPGEQIPVDGRVIEGASQVDESIWTGMSSLVEKNVGSRVLSGTQNKGGALTVLVDADGVHSALARLVANVREGFELKAVRSGIADSMSQKYVPAVVITAVGAALLWSWKGPEPRLGFAFTSLAMILIAACPWAVTTASPIAIAFGLRRGKRLGMRIRNPRVLEKLDRVDVVIFDKKGVLTEGCPRIRDVIRFGRWDEEELLQKAVVAQRRTGHPFASTLAHRASKADIPEAESQESYPGQGVAVTLGGDRILAGSLAWISRQGISVPAEGERRLKRSPDPVLVLAVCGQAAGAVIFEDEIRPGVREVVRELEKMGIEAVLASGDHNASAHRVAEEVGIRQVYSEVGEEEKVEIVREFQTQGKKVVMIGDGKRDAAALSRADLGISIGTEGEEGLRLSERRPVLGAGIDLAAESADIVLIRRDLDHLLGALRLSLKIREVIRENLKWVFGFHILLIPAAAGAYMLSFSAGFPPAAILTAASLSLAAILVNSIRRFKRER